MTDLGSNREKGSKGEKLALKYLRRKGYRLAEKNFKAIKCEVDIIVRKGNTLVFVEVKSRTHGGEYGDGKEAVDARKQYNIKKAAQVFLKNNDLWDMNIRFDVIEVNLENGEINHIEAAFM